MGSSRWIPISLPRAHSATYLGGPSVSRWLWPLKQRSGAHSQTFAFFFRGLSTLCFLSGVKEASSLHLGAKHTSEGTYGVLKHLLISESRGEKPELTGNSLAFPSLLSPLVQRDRESMVGGVTGLPVKLAQIPAICLLLSLISSSSHCAFAIGCKEFVWKLSHKITGLTVPYDLLCLNLAHYSIAGF